MSFFYTIKRQPLWILVVICLGILGCGGDIESEKLPGATPNISMEDSLTALVGGFYKCRAQHPEMAAEAYETYLGFIAQFPDSLSAKFYAQIAAAHIFSIDSFPRALFEDNYEFLEKSQSSWGLALLNYIKSNKDPEVVQSATQIDALIKAQHLLWSCEDSTSYLKGTVLYNLGNQKFWGEYDDWEVYLDSAFTHFEINGFQQHAAFVAGIHAMRIANLELDRARAMEWLRKGDSLLVVVPDTARRIQFQSLHASTLLDMDRPSSEVIAVYERHMSFCDSIPSGTRLCEQCANLFNEITKFYTGAGDIHNAQYWLDRGQSIRSTDPFKGRYRFLVNQAKLDLRKGLADRANVLVGHAKVIREGALSFNPSDPSHRRDQEALVEVLDEQNQPDSALAQLRFLISEYGALGGGEALDIYMSNWLTVCANHDIHVNVDSLAQLLGISVARDRHFYRDMSVLFRGSEDCRFYCDSLLQYSNSPFERMQALLKRAGCEASLGNHSQALNVANDALEAGKTGVGLAGSAWKNYPEILRILELKIDLFFYEFSTSQSPVFLDSVLTNCAAAGEQIRLLYCYGHELTSLMEDSERFAQLRLKAISLLGMKSRSDTLDFLVAIESSIQNRNKLDAARRAAWMGSSNYHGSLLDSLNKKLKLTLTSERIGESPNPAFTAEIDELLGAVYQARLEMDQDYALALDLEIRPTIDRMISKSKLTWVFFEMEDSLHRIEIGGDQVRLVKAICDLDWLRNNLQSTRIAEQGWQGYSKEVLRQLGDRLLPATPSVGGDLQILTSQHLKGIPFAALPCSWNPNEMLIEAFDISYLHSLSGGDMPEATSLETYPELVAFAPAYHLKYDVPRPNASRSWLEQLRPGLLSDLVPLGNVQEVEEQAGRWESEVYLGELATEDQLKKVLGAGILYFSGHAFGCVSDQPANGGLILSEALTSRNMREDGVLHGFELAGINCNTELTVLSGCQTGVGPFVPGEGVDNLAGAFHSAGSASVVTTLWKVSDASTLEIMKSFFDYLAKGFKKSYALCQAQRDFRTAHPTAPAQEWAAFILSGDNGSLSFIPQGKRDISIGWIVGMIFALVGGIVCVFAIKSARQNAVKV